MLLVSKKKLIEQVEEILSDSLATSEFKLVKTVYKEALEDKLDNIINRRSMPYKLQTKIETIIENELLKILEEDPEIKKLFKESFKRALENMFKPEEKQNEF